MAINTNKLKPFAQKARNILMDGVSQKILFWGFDQKGELIEEPQKIEGGILIRGKIIDDQTAYAKYSALKSAIKNKGVKQICEEAAYTWFNRIIAITILSKNGYIQSQMEYGEGDMRSPLIMQRARRGQNAFLDATEVKRLSAIIDDFEKENDAFAILLIGFCHNHILLKNVFGSFDDYSELLLPNNILADTGFIHLLNTTDAITNDDYKKVELIGWLYQFYISEKKDEVFKKFKDNKKAEKEDIPAATQIFTPNWIVKYMVENTVGQLWLDLHPESPLKEQMKYRVEPAEGNASSEPIIKEIADLKLLDPAVGSGHILAEGFDLLYAMYEEELYPNAEAVESILKNNLFGLDIDKRATQLAQFAILLKAAQKHPAIIEKGILPQVYAMPEPRFFSRQDILDFLGNDGAAYEEKLTEALKLMLDAQNLGSTMIFDLPEDCVTHSKKRLSELIGKTQRNLTEESLFKNIEPYIQIILILSSKYEAVAANPPYMGQKNMNAYLKEYVDNNYSDSSYDLMTIFVDAIRKVVPKEGYFSFINIPTWMFSISFKKFRYNLLKDCTILGLIDLGRGIFGSDFGTVVCFLKNSRETFIGEFVQLYTKFSLITSANEKQNIYLKRIFLSFHRHSKTFLDVDDYKIAYWLNENIVVQYSRMKSVKDYISVRKGLSSANDNLYLRMWFEPSFSVLSFNNSLNQKWFPITKGGRFRKWYGNNTYVVNWENDGRILKSNPKAYIRSEGYYFKESLTYGYITVSEISFRYIPEGFLFTAAGPVINKGDLYYFLAYLNSKPAANFIKVNTGNKVTFEIGEIQNTKVIYNKNLNINELAKTSIRISKLDWDSRETSWDFRIHPFLLKQKSLVESYKSWYVQVCDDFFNLHANEEEINRVFIEIFNLQDELIPDVALKDVTILQDELDHNLLEQLAPMFREKGKQAIDLPIKKNIVIQQLISYAIGCMMGRYRLDKQGLQIAHPNPTEDEVCSYLFNGKTYKIDEDAIIPMMGSRCTFADDAMNRLKEFLSIVWSEEKLTENINFAEECLKKDIESYLVKDFWNNHCKMYSKRPIYWLFSSKKGAFQILVYMHRMNKFTVEKIRSNYLLKHIQNLDNQLQLLKNNSTSLSRQEMKRMEQLQNDILECRDYDLYMKDIADKQIEFDLDDGVVENYKLFESVVAKIK